ncbi:MAG: CRISPR-associated endonuclease Cas3'' [Desulfurococcaceae archaeon]
MVIYSFFNEGVKERLRDHVLYALETFSETSRLVIFGNKLNRDFYLMLKYSIMLHDFGKVIFNQYKRTEVQRMSFEGHEIISAWFANEYLRRMKGLISPDERAMIVLSILLHHHPMSLRERADRLEEALSKKAKSVGELVINKETLEGFYAELDGIIEPVFINVDKSVKEILEETVGYSGIQHESLSREYWKNIWMNGTPNKRKTFLLLTQGLVAADYNAASKVRGEGISEFAKTISTYLKYWT